MTPENEKAWDSLVQMARESIDEAAGGSLLSCAPEEVILAADAALTRLREENENYRKTFQEMADNNNEETLTKERDAARGVAERLYRAARNSHVYHRCDHNNPCELCIELRRRAGKGEGMKKPNASEETVLRFVKAVYPGHGELSLSMKCEAETLLDATSELAFLRSDNERLTKERDEATGGLHRVREWCEKHGFDTPTNMNGVVPVIRGLLESTATFPREAEVEMYKRLLQEQVDATEVVTKELSACYAELGIFRHPDKPDRGPDAIKRLMEALDMATHERDEWCKSLNELRRRT